MLKTKLFAAAAVLTSLVATPVLAKTAGVQSQSMAQIKKQQIKISAIRQSDRRDRMRTGYDDRMGFDQDYARSNTGFFPLDAATGIVGGAIGTAGAIAAAPFGGTTYDNGWNNGYRSSRAGYDDGYTRPAYRDSYAAVNAGRVGAFATAPYTNPYEYNRASRDGGWYGQTYSQRNGFVCEPGTVFTNANGIRTLCQ